MRIFFDRIINSHTILSSRKFEVLDKICMIHSITLRNTEYSVRIMLWTSNQYYKYSTSFLIHGNGQDAGSSGTNWVYISVSIMSTLGVRSDLKICHMVHQTRHMVTLRGLWSCWFSYGHFKINKNVIWSNIAYLQFFILNDNN